MCSLALLTGSVCATAMEPVERSLEREEEERGALLGFFLRDGFGFSCLLPPGGASEDTLPKVESVQLSQTL